MIDKKQLEIVLDYCTDDMYQSIALQHACHNISSWEVFGTVLYRCQQYDWFEDFCYTKYGAVGCISAFVTPSSFVKDLHDWIIWRQT